MDPLESEQALIEVHCTPLAIDCRRNYNVIFASIFDSENKSINRIITLISLQTKGSLTIVELSKRMYSLSFNQSTDRTKGI